MNYWLNLFSPTTWREFVEHGSDVTGFPETMVSHSKRVKVGDRFVCYVTGISRVIGVLEVLSESYEDNTEIIWKGGKTFPVRFKVNPIVTLTFDQSIPFSLFRDKLKMFDKVGENWSMLVRGSLRKIEKYDGDLILEGVVLQEKNPVLRPVSQKKLNRKRVSSMVTDSGTVVTLPDPETGGGESEDDGEPDQSKKTHTDHTEIQYLLLRLGSEMGFAVWCPRSDRNKKFEGRSLSDVSGMMDNLPTLGLDRTSTTIIENIDVLWFKKNQPVSGFEVESTTSIYSGLLRLSDLIRTVPHINTDLFIVYPDERREKVLREVNRPTFKEGVNPTISERVRMISFSDLRSNMTKGEDVGLRYLPPEWVNDELSESCEIED